MSTHSGLPFLNLVFFLCIMLLLSSCTYKYLGPGETKKLYFAPCPGYTEEQTQFHAFNGFGSYAYPDGSNYEGEWKNGMMHGLGTFKYPDGIKYAGQWKDGKAHGMGIMTWPDNAKYVGQWKDNKRNGQGAMTYPDGTKQVGEFRDGKFVEK